MAIRLLIISGLVLLVTAWAMDREALDTCQAGHSYSTCMAALSR